jgi:hypothetical protein
MLSRIFVSYSLLDGHDVRFANIAEPFPIAHICEIFSMFEVSSRSRHASWTLIRVGGDWKQK